MAIQLLSYLLNRYRDGQGKGAIKPADHRDLAETAQSWGAPVVADNTARAAIFPSPVGDERVFNKASGNVERYSATSAAWVTDFAGASQLPTLEELESRALLPTSIAATATVYLGPTNFNQRVGALSLSFSAAIAASDTDFWSIAIQRLRNNGTAVTLSTQTTKVTGGIAIAANTAWTFDNAVWPSALRYLRKGDILRLVFTKTGAPAALADGCAVLRYEPDVIPLVRDTFTRPDSLTSLGTSDSGHVWSVVTLPTVETTPSVFGIKTNAAAIQVHAQPGSPRDYAVIDAGVADCSVSAIVSDVTNAGLAVRVIQGTPLSDVTKHPSGYINNASTLFRSDNGTLTSITALSPSLANGDEVTIVCSGSTFTVYKNGVLVGTGTDATYTSTKHGFRNSAATVNTPLWDDFTVAL